jgi:hypothetical protein
MAGGIPMTIDEILAWAESKNCGPRRKTGACEHEACDQNDRVIAILRTARRFKGTNANGASVSGWLIPDS